MNLESLVCGTAVAAYASSVIGHVISNAACCKLSSDKLEYINTARKRYKLLDYISSFLGLDLIDWELKVRRESHTNNND